MRNKAYLEITNVCNLTCSFCHGTKRDKRFMSVEEFRLAAQKLRGEVKFLYFHLMGEPLLHPNLPAFFEIAEEYGFRVILTSNGTLLQQRAKELLQAKSLYKISISLHCYEVNAMGRSLEEYLDSCTAFCKNAAQQGILCVLRLWNRGGADSMNETILRKLHEAFPEEWVIGSRGDRLAERIFLEWGERFDWPDLEAQDYGGAYHCYGLRDQIGILCDGTVVPCCLDADGAIALGNLFAQELSEILESPRATALKRSLQNRCACEELCRRCGYAHQKQY